MCSHHKPVDECEAAATKALAIARAVDDQPLIAGALHALSVVVWDPARHMQHWDWTDELLSLSKQHPEEPWHRWALPVVARLRASDGDLAGAADALDELRVEADRCEDAGGRFAASYLPLLRASVRGDWPAARHAASDVRAAGEAALLDPMGAALQEMGMLGIISLLSGPTDVAPLPPIEWPMPSMEVSAKSWHANCLARAGQTAQAVAVLNEIDSSVVVDGDRDTYWLSTLSMLADAAHLAGHAATAEAVWECLRPVAEMTILDGALIYRGAAAHFAGLAAAACGHERQARELLAEGLERHAAHQSPWMLAQSQAAIDSLERDLKRGSLFPTSAGEQCIQVLAHLVRLFEVCEVAAVLEHHELRAGDSACDLTGDLDRDEVAVAVDDEGSRSERVELRQKVVPLVVPRVRVEPGFDRSRRDDALGSEGQP